MDSISILFISIIVFLGGLTAYIADFLGRYMGKKKLTFLGIRPKYTAISFTVFAGILIPLITTIALYYSSSDVRIWIKEGQHAALQRDHKVQELEYMISKIAQRTEEVKELEIKQSEAKSRLNQAQKEIKQAQLQTIKAKKRLQKINTELQKIKTDYKILSKNFEVTQLTSLDLKDKNQALLKLKIELINDLNIKNKNTQEISKQLVSLQTHVDDLNEQKQIIHKQFNETSTQLRKDIEYTQIQLKLARNERDKIIAETEQAKNNMKEGLELNIYNTRFTPILFKQGEELAAISIPPKSPLPKVIGLIDQLKLKASIKAKKYNTDLEHALSENQMQNLYESLVSQTTSIKAVLLTTWNTFEKETVPYTILVVEQNTL